MQPLLQSKLLRVLEERQVRRLGGRQDIPIDATVFATTNKDLTEAVENGEFRSDLFYRMNAFALHVPPIRERPEDIKALARHFLEHFRTRYQRMSLRGFSAEADQALVSYGWPGNVRELRNVIERIVVLESGETILPRHLPRALSSRGPAAGHAVTLPDDGISLEDVEKSLIAQALEKAAGNKTVAAKLLHMTYDSLRYQIKKYGLE